MSSRSPRPNRSAARFRRAPRPRGRRARAPVLGPVGARPWLFAAVALLLAVLPPTRAAGRWVWGGVREATAAVRAADARERMVAGYARRYGISMELASAIERAARAEGIETELAFRLVRVESSFDERAVSSMGALGLTQVMPGTARELQPGITRAEMLERDTNLRLGFRYLKGLLAYYDGDEEEALTAYNRGPGKVDAIRGAGGDPSNGYADLVLGARGSSPVNRVRHDTADQVPAAPPLHEVGPARLPSSF